MAGLDSSSSEEEDSDDDEDFSDNEVGHDYEVCVCVCVCVCVQHECVFNRSNNQTFQCLIFMNPLFSNLNVTTRILLGRVSSRGRAK